MFVCSHCSKRVKGKLVAYTTVCKLFCREHFYRLDSSFLAHFYRVIQHVCVPFHFISL